MANLALTERVLVDLDGMDLRVGSEINQGIPHGNFHPKDIFKDLGLVIHNGIEYYASVYYPHVEPEEE